MTGPKRRLRTESDRPDWDSYFLLMAALVAMRSSCARRAVGAVLVSKDHRRLTTGYNGKAAGLVDCTQSNCQGANSASGTNLEACEAIHAEQNALIKTVNDQDIHTAYTVASPCIHCVKMLLGTSCKRIVFLQEYPHSASKDLWKGAGREWVHYRGDLVHWTHKLEEFVRQSK